MATSTQHYKIPDKTAKTTFHLLRRFGLRFCLLLLCLLPLYIQAQSRLQTAKEFLLNKSTLKSAGFQMQQDASEDLILKYESTQAVRTPVAVYEHPRQGRSEEHTSELQSRPHLVCRLLLEKKKQ